MKATHKCQLHEAWWISIMQLGVMAAAQALRLRLHIPQASHRPCEAALNLTNTTRNNDIGCNLLPVLGIYSDNLGLPRVAELSRPPEHRQCDRWPTCPTQQRRPAATREVDLEVETAATSSIHLFPLAQYARQLHLAGTPLEGAAVLFHPLVRGGSPQTPPPLPAPAAAAGGVQTDTSPVQSGP